jgi:hypothetical protein
MYDPARKGPIDYAHLGNLGSSARPIWFQPLPSLGFKSGYQPFERYLLNPDQLAFYKHRRTYSDAFFTRGGSQRDAMSFIKLSRTFSKGLNVSLHYQTINNLGQYRFQRTKHGSLAVGAWWPVQKNYEVFLLFASNTFRQQDNGGIMDTDFAGPGYNGPISVPILLSNNDAKTVQSFQDFQINQYLNALQLGKIQVRASHQLNFKTEKCVLSDWVSQPRSGVSILVPGTSPLLYSDCRFSGTRFQCSCASASSTCRVAMALTRTCTCFLGW